MQDGLEAYVNLYNHSLSRLKENGSGSREKESKLVQALCGLSAIDLDKLKPSVTSMQQLKDNITNNLGNQGWLIEKVRSLEYDDGFSFRELLERN
jgi:hypothetical protein